MKESIQNSDGTITVSPTTSEASGGGPPRISDDNHDMGDEHNSIFAAAVQATRMPMIVTDPRLPDNPIVFANPAFLDMTGYSKEDLVGHNCRLLQGPETDREIVTQIRNAITSRTAIAVEMLNYKKNKSAFWNALFISPVFGPGGDLLYFFASQLDVTRRRDAEDALRRSQKMEAVGVLTAGIAHDFNNLLQVIRGYAEMMLVIAQTENIDRAKTMRYANAILESAQRGAALTQQLLAFARKQKLSGRVINLQDLITQLAPMIAQSVGPGVELVIEHGDHLCNARIDPAQAENAIINVANNARDAMNDSGTLTIRTGHCKIADGSTIYGGIEPGEYTVVKLIDTGTGMDPDTLAKVTEPFFTTKPEGKGTGLGLAMVYGFLKQSGGVFHIESEVGKGSTVHMLFKCVQGDADPKPVAARRTAAVRQGARETVLAVEDRADLLDYVKDVLEGFGYTVLTATNAVDAMAILDGPEKIELLFSDVVMPGRMNGVELAREAKRARPAIKVLLTTGYTESTLDMTDASGVAFDVLYKPAGRVELSRLVRQAIDGPDGVS